jgi:hypothetical protein
MLDCDDPKWKVLNGGYKMPYNPTSALTNLENDKNVEAAWDELWNELHHQGDVGEASYAAVPHLVRIQKQNGNLDWNLYALVSTIEIERHRKSNPNLPHWLEASYFEAWDVLLELGIADLQKTKDEITIRAILGTLALSKGMTKLGALISTLDESEIAEYIDEHLAWSELYR